MNSTIVRVENLSKSYLIGHQRQERYTALRDVIMSSARDFGRRLLHPLKSSLYAGNSTLEEFYALNDVSFEIKPGDRVGIIGRNGAGKSTLLKILSRITEPSSGRVTICGRVASLLEVGTGFHPELTGRENIFLNGAILGMGKAEIKRKFDEIVDFAEVEKFLDTPVKRYSSGMYVRLAFAVAAHMEPEIMVVDEVLAVGDAQFQKKCLGKMEDVSTKEGRTVLFVSHNMQAIRALCSRAILLSDGKLRADAPVNDTIEMYQKLSTKMDFDANTAVNNEKLRRGSGKARFTGITLQNAEGVETNAFQMEENISFAMSYVVSESIENLYIQVCLLSNFSKELVTSSWHQISSVKVESGHRGRAVVEFPRNKLRPREYLLYFWLGNKFGQPFDVVDDVLPPMVITTDKGMEELGFDPAEASGYFEMDSRLLDVN
jgi:lipopolysaccharide transport system ATP-binding protein